MANEIQKAIKKRDEIFKKKMKNVPKMAKELTKKFYQYITENPDVQQQGVLRNFTDEFMKFSSYSSPEFEGNMENSKEVYEYFYQQIIKKYEEVIYGTANRTVNNMSKKLKKTLDSLSIDQQKQLLKALS